MSVSPKGGSRYAPGASGLTRKTTQSVATHERLDFWRSLFIGSYIDRDDRSAGDVDFRGDFRGYAGADGTVFANLSADPIICNFGRRNSDLILVGCVNSGTLQVRHGDDGATVFDASKGLIVFDCDVPATAISTRYNLSYIALPRSAVVAAMGRETLPRGKAGLFLPEKGLAAIVLAHLRAFSTFGDELNSAESASAMQAFSALALTLLAGLSCGPVDAGPGVDTARFLAARRYMAAHLGQELTAQGVAAVVGCSRAYLYKIFAARDQTVAGYLQDLRLSHARNLLRSQPTQAVGQIAFGCGYTDPSAFGKAFRRRFGVSPRECREMTKAPTEASINLETPNLISKDERTSDRATAM